jgi:hypothetical protein
MPLNETGKKVRKEMQERYGGKKEGDRVFFSTENKKESFRHAMTKKAKAEWWYARIEKLPAHMKSTVMGLAEIDYDTKWWLKRIKPINLNKAKSDKESHTP